MTVTVRFAPSPTGHIHIGNARTALFNWLFALKRGGTFILRFDDTDAARSTRAFADQIENDLAWLGVRPAAVVRQSDRISLYNDAAARLKASGVLYPCYETSEELERRRRIRLQRRLPPVYGREALRLSEAERLGLEAEGRKPHWRFLLPNYETDPHAPQRTEITWNDAIRGAETVDLASISDPVLIREDGTYLYTLPSVVDDIELGVTHVIRGDDHITNTGAQIALFRALHSAAPEFGHHNLLTAASGEGLSKRTGALSIKALREDGIEPMAVASLAVLIGTSEAVSAVPEMDTLAGRFDISSSSKGVAKFDPGELLVLNRALLREMPFDEIRDRLSALGIDGAKAPAFWLALRGNIERLSDVQDWWKIIGDGPLSQPGLADEDLQFVRDAFELLPPEPWDRGTWKVWTDTVKEKTGRKGKALFAPLRVALTGFASGPELADLLPLLGREGTLARRP